MRMTRIAGVALAALALAGCGQASSTHSSPHALSSVKNLVLTAAATHTRHAGSAATVWPGILLRGVNEPCLMGNEARTIGPGE